MPHVYSILAKRMIEVPDKKPGKEQPLAAIDGNQGRIAQQLTGWLLEAESQITALTAKLEAETTARKTVEAEVVEERGEAESAEKKVTTLSADLVKARAETAKAEADGRVAVAKAEGATAAERAARVAAEQRATAAEKRCKQLEVAPKPMPAGPDLKQITAAVRSAVAVQPAPKPTQLPYEVIVTERDANGRIRRFQPRFTN